MKTTLVFFSVLSLLSSSVVFAKQKSLKAHVHGAAKLNLVIEGFNLEIELEIPAHDIVGFERAPKNEKEVNLVSQAEASLKSADKTIQLPKKAECKLKSASASNSLSKKRHSHGDHDHHHEKEAHAEFTVSYEFRCDEPKYLSRITFAAFEKFSKIKRISAQAVTMSGQFAAKLTPRNPTLKLFKN